MAARSVEREARDDVPEAAGLDGEVGGLEDDRERRLVDRGRAGEERRKRVVLGRELLASEEQRARDRRSPLEVEVARELEGDRETALHVARAEPVHGAVGDASRKVLLRRNRVVVSRQHHERKPARLRRDEQERLVAGVLEPPAPGASPSTCSRIAPSPPLLGGNVDQLERPRSEAVGERGHARSVQRHNLAVTPRQPDPAPGAEPERGFLVGVYPKGSDRGAELAELRELSRTAGVAPVGEVVQQRGRPDLRTFVGKGKLRSSSVPTPGRRGRGAPRRRRAEPHAAARARRCAQRPASSTGRS